MALPTDTSPRIADSAWVRYGTLLVFGAVTALVAWLGSLATTSNVDSDWFRSLEKPAFYPPDALFGIVWTVLYVGITWAGWLAWRGAGGLSMLLPWTVQLVLNLGWTVFFFAAQQPGWAMVVILALLGTAVWTAGAMWQHSHTATFLFVPYILWIGFAGALNWSIIALN